MKAQIFETVLNEPRVKSMINRVESVVKDSLGINLKVNFHYSSNYDNEIYMSTVGGFVYRLCHTYNGIMLQYCCGKEHSRCQLDDDTLEEMKVVIAGINTLSHIPTDKCVFDKKNYKDMKPKYLDLSQFLEYPGNADLIMRIHNPKKIKWYYAYLDGILVVSSKVDGKIFDIQHIDPAQKFRIDLTIDTPRVVEAPKKVNYMV